jgi:hypothetical protein
MGVKVDSRYLEVCCQEHPLGEVLPALRMFQQDDNKARRYWAWAAFAIEQYKYEREERRQYVNELSPKGIIELLAQIRESARDLAEGLCQLQEHSYRLNDPSAPPRRPHIAWLDDLISQAAAGLIAGEVSNDIVVSLAVDSNKFRLLERLRGIEVAAGNAQRRADRGLLERERGQSEPALLNFVFRCGKIWKGLTGRAPSANKVHSKHRDPDPDFVVFVQELALIVETHEPTRDQILVCLRRSKRKTITTKISS